MTDGLAIELAAITGAHGIHGEVRLKLFTDDLAAFAAYGRYRVGDRDLVLKHTKQVG
ncbi:MAG: 16S rRNA processing protein RimM, partial [Pseudomonadota bacterium]